MKRQSIFLILLLLQVFMICTGCGSTEKSAVPESPAADIEEAAIVMEEVAAQEAIATVEDAIGIFEGLEDNHTAVFSFDGAETAFYFDEPAVQKVLFEAVIGSSYTLSFEYDDSIGYVIYKISE